MTEHQQAEEQVEGRDGDDDRDDPEVVDQRRVQRSQADADEAGQDEAGGPVAAAHLHQDRDREILDDGGRDRERDIDPAGDQDDEQAGREDDVDGGVVQQVEQVDEGQERVGGQREKDADQGDDEDEPLLGRPYSASAYAWISSSIFSIGVRPGMYSAMIAPSRMCRMRSELK